MLVLVYTPLLQSSGSSSLFLLLDVGGSLWASLGNGSAALQKNMFPSCNVCAVRDMGYKRMYYIHTLYSMPRIPHRPLP